MSTQLTAAAYDLAFQTECANTYPVIDALEASYGYAVDRAKLEAAARVLACPVKANPPNWQHGRVIYAVARQYFAQAEGLLNVLDIGTAKGFSALCLQWALDDSGRIGQVTSVDVIDPAGTERRNTVAELDGPVTLRDILRPWPESEGIYFAQSTGIAWLQRHRLERVHVAFVDGKHSAEAVTQEAAALALCQQAGDVVIFDDVQIPGVAQGVAVAAKRDYTVTFVCVKPERTYAIGVRRG